VRQSTAPLRAPGATEYTVRSNGIKHWQTTEQPPN
jgi:hypothetical protein